MAKMKWFFRLGRVFSQHDMRRRAWQEQACAQEALEMRLENTIFGYFAWPILYHFDFIF